MAYLKILPVATNMHLSNLVKYITRPDKTDEQFFVSAVDCKVPTAVRDFATVRAMADKRRGLVAHQIVRSFPRGEVEPEQAQQMAEEFAAKMLPGYQYIVCTHVDRDHIHTHIVFNSVSYLTGEKYYGNKASLRVMRDESDALCRKYGLSIIDPSARSGLDRRTLEAAQRGGSWKVQLAITLDDLIDWVTSLPELQTELKAAGFHIERWTDRDATIRKDGETKAIRLSALARQFGWQYSLPALQQRLLGEDLTPPAPPNRPESPTTASEWSRYQAWAFNQHPQRPNLRQRTQLLAKSVRYNKDPLRAAVKALTLLALDRQNNKTSVAIRQLIGRATVSSREHTVGEGRVCGNIDYRTLTQAYGKNVSVRLPAADLIQMQAADFFFAARLRKDGKTDVTFKETDADKVSQLLGININELLSPTVTKADMKLQADAMEELKEFARENHTHIWRLSVSPAEVQQLRQSGLTAAFWRNKAVVGMYDACFIAEDLSKICSLLGKDYATERQKRIGQDAKADYAKLKADANRKGAKIIYRVVDEELYRQLLQAKLPMAAFPKGAAYNVAFLEGKLKRYEQLMREIAAQPEQELRQRETRGALRES